jgi:YesN/AraC family two-component response regulator
MIPDVVALVASLPAALGTCYLRHAEEAVQGGRLQALILRVVVVDDSEVVRRGICHILLSQAEIEVVCEASDGADAVRKVLEHRPDIVLLDITMPVMNGFEAARRIKHELPSTLILMVSQFDSDPFAREAVAAGASGYVVKSNASTELIPALRKIQSQHQRFAIGNHPAAQVRVETD